MDELPPRYVVGYDCPNCKATNVGVETRDASTGRIVGWLDRVRLEGDTRVRCFNCDAEVPTEFWRIEERK